MEGQSLFIKGRYKKFSRDIPQNNPGEKHRTSVADIINNAGKFLFFPEKCFFHAAGREDKDTLMLGSGRPFILEIVNPPKSNISLEKIAESINLSDDIKVFELVFCEKQEIERLKNSKWDKTYQAKVVFEKEISKIKVIEAISTLTGAIISQRTPERVNDSRSDLIRKRKIIFFKLKDFSNDKALFEIKAESGTYIKELISGDKQRTKPNLSSLLGVKCKVFELDVIGINDD